MDLIFDQFKVLLLLFLDDVNYQAITVIASTMPWLDYEKSFPLQNSSESLTIFRDDELST